MIIFGLGNPGSRYAGTRHNVGFMTIERLAASYGIKMRKRCFSHYRWGRTENLVLVEPLTYMNRSGEVFPSLVEEGDAVVVVVDNMDLPVGRIRLKKAGGSSAGHNGLKSIISCYGNNFIRLYVGVGRPAEGVNVPDHVLSNFTAEEGLLLGQALDEACQVLRGLVEGEDFNAVVQRANSFIPSHT